jgi:signal peptidase I
MGFLALGASFFLPGLGQLVSRRWRRGIVWLAVVITCQATTLFAVALPALVPALLVLLPLTFLVQLWMWIDSFRCGQRTHAPILGRPFINYPVGLLLIAAALFVPVLLKPALMVRDHLVEAFVISSASMNPSIVAGDRVLAHKRVEPKRWDIVVFNSPQSPGQRYIVRLAGLPGEKIEIVHGVLNVNGKPMPSPAGLGPYVGDPPRSLRDMAGQYSGLEGAPITLATDEYYVLGDNSSVALDSRYWSNSFPGHQRGTFGRADIVGVVTWTYFPPGHWKSLRP